MNPDPNTQAARQRQEEIDAHVLRAIWCSIEAHQHDRDGEPAAAADASLDAAAHVRCATFLAGLRR